MSYDLMVFDPATIPRNPDAFLAWYEVEVENAVGDPAIVNPRLESWYRDMIVTFPDMNDPDLSDDDIGKLKLAGYSWTQNIIYSDFRWPDAELAYKTVVELAQKHKLGFFDASGEGAVWAPLSDGGYRQLFKAGS